jgi:hypothetical protein
MKDNIHDGPSYTKSLNTKPTTSTTPTKLNQFYKDFCSWIRGHENLYYHCLIKIKHFISKNVFILLFLLFLYYRFDLRYFILFLYYRITRRVN